MGALLRSQLSVCAALIVVSGSLTSPAWAQQSTNSDSSGGQSSTQTTVPSKKQQAPPAQKNSAQENPFPGDVSQHAVQQQQQGSQPPAAPDAPDAPGGGQAAPQPPVKPGDAAKDNPFPEDVSKGAAAAAAKDSEAGTDANGSGSSSSSSSNPGGNAAAGDADPNVDPNGDLPKASGRRKLRKPSEKDIQSGSLAGEGKAQDDIRIGRFYLGEGNYQGAYGRFSEASRLDPVNAEAIYGLAAAAAGLHHTDEALTNYKLYLQVAPDGDQAKSARKAIHTLSK